MPLNSPGRIDARRTANRKSFNDATVLREWTKNLNGDPSQRVWRLAIFHNPIPKVAKIDALILREAHHALITLQPSIHHSHSLQSRHHAHPKKEEAWQQAL
jgi:hypothetical protein